jgi:hypothetical protein
LLLSTTCEITSSQQMVLEIFASMFYLVFHVTIRALCRVPLVFGVDESLDHPLVVERREPSRLIEQLVHEFVRAVWFHLQIYQQDYTSINLVCTVKLKEHTIEGYLFKGQ